MISQEFDYYSILNISREASQEEIALAYRKLAIRFHPNRSESSDYPFNAPEGIPDENNFPAILDYDQWRLVNQAYDILSNPLRREVYDRYGEAGLLNGVPLPNGFFPPYVYHGFCFETYREVLGSYSPYANIIDAIANPSPLYSTETGMAIKRKDKAVEKLLYLNLKEIYFGGVKRMTIFRHEFVDIEKTTTEIREKVLIVEINPGILAGTKIIFPEEGDQGPTKIPADIVFITADKTHERFRRMCSDLYMDYKLSLKQALCGVNIVIQTIDGRRLLVSVNDVIHPCYIKEIKNEGLPKQNDTSQKGSLFILFEIEFPKYIPREMKPKITKLFNEFQEYSTEDQRRNSTDMVNKFILEEKMKMEEN